VETGILDAVERLCNFGAVLRLNQLGHDLTDLLLADLLLNVTEARWERLVEQRATERGAAKFATEA
jgi:hypothetical protein